MNCRHCGARLELLLVDLGTSPPSNAYLTASQLSESEPRYPLRVRVCESCWLVQTEDYPRREDLFDANYAYFSAYSSTWVEHVERYVDDARRRFNLDRRSFVVEVAANDGHLLQFVRARGIPCIGIEPTAAAAAAARQRGISVVEDFFGNRLATELAAESRADLIVANNVLAHVPDINDFAAGFATLLKPSGVATFEFAYVRSLIDHTLFDTIYHEHYSYLSMTAVDQVLSAQGLTVFDVEKLNTHGGSLRVFAKRSQTLERARTPAVDDLLAEEAAAGMTTRSYYERFQPKVEKVRDDLVKFLHEATHSTHKHKVAAYGAAAKGSTLLNYANLGASIVEFVVDANPAKRGKFMPGSHIPIVGGRPAAAGTTGLCAHSAVESSAGDNSTDQLHRQLGRALRRCRPTPRGPLVRIAVTGAGGFIGRHVVQDLESRGVRATAIY